MIGRAEQNSSIYGAGIYQYRVDYQGERKSGSLLEQLRLNRDQKADRQTPGGQYSGVDQTRVPPPATKQKHFGALYIDLALSSRANCKAKGYERKPKSQPTLVSFE